MLYRKGKFCVDVASNGAIKVKPGDWLSKYSYAMFGDFKHIGEFGRPDNRGVVVPVQNPNRIYAGETLYHLPTYNKALNQAGVKPSTPPPPPPPPQPSRQEEKQNIINGLISEYKLTPESAEILSKTYEILEGVGKAAEFAEIFDLLEVAGPAGLAASIIGVPLQMIALYSKWDINEKLTAAQAIAYAATAWAYNKTAPPPLSPTLRYYVSQGGGMDLDEKKRTEHAWDEAARGTFQQLDVRVAGGKPSKAVLQAAFQALTDRDPGKLCEKILRGFDKQMTQDRNIQRAWEGTYDILAKDIEKGYLLGY